MAWPTSNVAVAGTTIPESDHNELRADILALNGFVRKTADESVTSSTVPQNDNELLIAIPAAGTFLIEVTLMVTSAANAAGDFRIAATFPTGTMYMFTNGADSTLASASAGPSEHRAQAITSGVDPALAFGASTTGTTIAAKFLLVATASGTFTLQWAQAASNANATTVRAGSFLTMKQVA